MRIVLAGLFSIVLTLFSVSGAEADTAIFQIKSNIPNLPHAAKAGDKILGHQAIIENMQARATESQSDFIGAVNSLQAQGKIDSYKRFWIANVVVVSASREIIDQLSARADVEIVFDDLPISLISPVETGDAEINSVGHETGLDVVEAPGAWAIGLDGTGSLVCNFDTGVFGNHPALIDKYRGNNGGSPSESWFDPYTNTLYPSDSHGHGTHTMGTMVGSTAGDTIGVAPGAQWIAAAVVDRGGGIQRTISDILAAFQWAADPDGDPSTTSDVPDVINNSWGIPLGYYPACDQTFWTAIDNLEAAGVVCVFAAGNEGPYASTIRTPADRITTDFNAFSVGAVNGNLGDLPIASFSSRGPSGCDGVTIKPEVTAPGVSIRSAGRTGGYVTMSGTSMATPHIAGAVAILRQFNPNATPAQIKQALMYSARDLGLQGEDNAFGWGVIDIRRALNFMPPPDGIFPALAGLEISGDGIADPGEDLEISLRVENLGRPGFDLSAALTTQDSRVDIHSGSIHISQFDHNDTVLVGPFQVAFSSDISLGEHIPFVAVISSPGDSREVRFSIIAGGGIEPAVATHDNGQVRFSFSNFGQFGLGQGSVNPMGGDGFRFPSNGLDFLKSGTLMLATDQSHVSDGAITVNPSITDDDFSPVEGGYPRIIEPGIYSDQDGFSAYDDNAAEYPIGLRITQRSFCWTDQSAYPFVITEFTIENVSGVDINSLLVGIFCDWDLPLSSGNDDVVNYVDSQTLGYVMDLSTGTAVGVKAITGDVSSYAAIDNAQSFGDGFSETEKYDFMSSGFSNISYSAPGNYSHLITAGPFRLAAGESEVAAFSFVAGANLDDLIANAAMSSAMYPGYTDVTPGEPVPDRFDIITNYPNPFNGRTVIELSTAVVDNQTIEIYDIAGRLVRSLAVEGKSQVVWDGTDGRGNEVAAGIYFARLSSGETNTRKMLFLK